MKTITPPPSIQTILRPLLQNGLTRHFNEGSTIYYQGEVPRGAGIVKSGLVRVYNISASGDEQIVDFIGPGEFFPGSWLFGKSPATLFFYEAAEASDIVFITRQELMDFLEAHTERMLGLVHYLATKATASLIRISALEQTKARDKLIYTLFFLCHRHGVQQNGRVHIKLHLTHQHLAALVGLTRETTATEMSRLKKEGVLTYGNQHYVIDLRAVIELMGEESFQNISISV